LLTYPRARRLLRKTIRVALKCRRVRHHVALPVANYVDGNWRAWLQSNRVELNAMACGQNTPPRVKALGKRDLSPEDGCDFGCGSTWPDQVQLAGTR
jgi:hypothetical protein